MSPTEMAYRKTAVEGASGFGLLMALYDTLAGNLRRAAEAERSNDIEKRCREAHHALLVIGYLEDAVNRGTGGDLSDQLIPFYSSLRRKLIEAQAKRSAEMLEQQMALVLSVRGTWQEIEFRASSAQEDQSSAEAHSYSGVAPLQDEPAVYSWSA